MCGSHSVAIPVVLVLPYIFRLFQCLRQYKDSGEKSSLLNGKIVLSRCIVLALFKNLLGHVLLTFDGDQKFS